MPGTNVLLDVVVVVVRRLLSDSRLGVGIEPQPYPLGHGVFTRADHIEMRTLFHGRFQLFLYLGLRFTEDIFGDGLAGGRIMTGGVAALPPAILTFTDVAFTVCPFLSRNFHLLF